jgi:ribosomal protein L37AE/L43A
VSSDVWKCPICKEGKMAVTPTYGVWMCTKCKATLLIGRENVVLPKEKK